MTSFEKVNVAAVQATPVILDPEASIEKAGALLRECGAAIVEPDDGEVIAGPLYGEEGIVTAECDLRVGLHAKRWFDVVGHYSREDVLGSVVPRSDVHVPFPPPRADHTSAGT